MKKSKITSHILDVEKGRPAADVLITLEIKENGKWSQICQGKTDADGRVMDWTPEEINKGHYKISFDVQTYFSSQNRECFYPGVSIEFYLKDINQHYHVPLLLSGHGYSTYRGS